MTSPPSRIEGRLVLAVRIGKNWLPPNTQSVLNSLRVFASRTHWRLTAICLFVLRKFDGDENLLPLAGSYFGTELHPGLAGRGAEFCDIWASTSAMTTDSCSLVFFRQRKSSNGPSRKEIFAATAHAVRLARLGRRRHFSDSHLLSAGVIGRSRESRDDEGHRSKCGVSHGFSLSSRDALSFSFWNRLANCQRDSSHKKKAVVFPFLDPDTSCR